MRTTRTSLFTIAAMALLLGMLTLTSACKPKECTRMTECCAEIQGMDGVGNACGSLTELNVKYNDLGDEGKAAIQEAVRGKEGFKLEINTT